jgi:hypothetical protein
MKHLIVSVCAVAMLAGCANRERLSYVDQYQRANAEVAGSPLVSDAPIRRFIDLYRDLQGPDLTQRVDAVYAPVLYFSDTLHVFHDRPSLRQYLIDTAKAVDSIDIQVDRIIQDGADVWLSWRMSTQARAVGRTMRADTIGMTHLRFDQQGQVVLHQDYWDSTEGLFAHIPFVGAIVRWTRNRL